MHSARSVLEDIIDNVEYASKKNPSILNAAAREDLTQIRLVLDMARDAALYAKEAKETYELLSTVRSSIPTFPRHHVLIILLNLQKVRGVDEGLFKPAEEIRP